MFKNTGLLFVFQITLFSNELRTSLLGSTFNIDGIVFLEISLYVSEL